MKTIETTVYDFNELSEKAKEAARAWLRGQEESDNDWAGCTIEEWQNGFLTAMGWSGAKIGYRGFWSQGDGAHFEGEWHSCNVRPDWLTEQGITDEDLARFLSEYAELAKKYPSSFCRVRHRGHYQHENCTLFDNFEVLDGKGDHVPEESYDDFAQKIVDLSKEVMRHIYSCLEKEYDFYNADTQVDERIAGNGHTFTAEGVRFG